MQEDLLKIFLIKLILLESRYYTNLLQKTPMILNTAGFAVLIKFYVLEKDKDSVYPLLLQYYNNLKDNLFKYFIIDILSFVFV